MTDAADSRRDRLARWDRWLDLRREPPLLPAQIIIDPHYHLWDRGGHTYLVEQFRADIAENRVVSCVYIECLSNYRQEGPPELRPVGETEFVARLGAAAVEPSGVCRGIVSFADLSLGTSVDRVLDAHASAAGVRLKGIRYATAWDPDPAIHGNYPTHQGMLLESSVRDAAQVLEQHGLSLDLWMYFHQLGEAQSLARACPALSLVIDHCGGPIGLGAYASRRSEVFEAWREKLQAFRPLRNVALKFGGLAMPLAGFAWKSMSAPPSSEALAQAWRPYFEVCLDVFGPQRCMFESNFPVDRSGCSYTVLWNAFKRLAECLSADERGMLFEHTARRIYRL